jgi:HSP90 family molecular chaperone
LWRTTIRKKKIEKIIKWLKKIFKKDEPEKFDNFLKELVKERKEALNPRQRGTRDTGPR